ncbi:MAG TPA: hypothetical protein VK598_04660, partial [Nitrospiraceae bacterium]|nr:hypothetical protein [Nitrospiraceae bacterium]
VRQRQRPWRVKRETCKTWTDWIPTFHLVSPVLPVSTGSLDYPARYSPVVPHVRTIKALARLDSFSAAC